MAARIPNTAREANIFMRFRLPLPGPAWERPRRSPHREGCRPRTWETIDSQWPQARLRSYMMRKIMQKLKLTVNEKKTRVCKLPEEKFDFLGYIQYHFCMPATPYTLVDTWQLNHRVTLQLLEHLNAAQLAYSANPRARSIGDQFAHLHHVRIQWLEVSRPTAVKTLRKIEKGMATQEGLRN